MMLNRETQKVCLQIAIVLGVTLLSAGAAQPVEAAELTLRGDVEVIEDTVYLSDVFDGVPLGEDGILTRSPAPGSNQILRHHDIADAVLRADHLWPNDERVRRIIITRASHAIEVEEIATLIENALVADGYGTRFDVNLSNRNFVLHLPVDQAPTVAIDRLRHDPQSGYFEVSLSAPGLGGETQILRGRAMAVLEIPVLAAQLPLNTEITERDLTYIDIAADRLGNGVATHASDLLGMAPRRNVRAGQPVRLADVGTPIIVERGDRVRVAYSVPGMSLTVIGEAVEDGSLGEIVRLRNTTTQVIFEARLLGGGRAEVAPQNTPQVLTVSMN